MSRDPRAPRPRGYFVTATGTGAGKTFVTRALARWLARRGTRVAALKPFETGCTPDPLDALALARACGNPELARDPAFYRVAPPLAPYAATLEHAPAPDLDAICARIDVLVASHAITLVEGAGGLLVPVGADHSMADVARRLALPLILIAPDRLGVLSHVLTASESAAQRALEVACVILVSLDPAPQRDPSTRTNARILGERLRAPVHAFPFAQDTDDALADALETTAIPTALALRT